MQEEPFPSKFHVSLDWFFKRQLLTCNTETASVELDGSFAFIDVDLQQNNPVKSAKTLTINQTSDLIDAVIKALATAKQSQ